MIYNVHKFKFHEKKEKKLCLLTIFFSRPFSWHFWHFHLCFVSFQMTNSPQSKELKIYSKKKNSFFVSFKKKNWNRWSIIFPANKKKNQFHFQNKKKKDLQDFEKLFIQPQSLANVVKLDLECKLQKKKKKRSKNKQKKNKQTKREIKVEWIVAIKLNSFQFIQNCCWSKLEKNSKVISHTKKYVFTFSISFENAKLPENSN